MKKLLRRFVLCFACIGLSSQAHAEVAEIASTSIWKVEVWTADQDSWHGGDLIIKTNTPPSTAICTEGGKGRLIVQMSQRQFDRIQAIATAAMLSRRSVYINYDTANCNIYGIALL